MRCRGCLVLDTALQAMKWTGWPDSIRQTGMCPACLANERGGIPMTARKTTTRRPPPLTYFTASEMPRVVACPSSKALCREVVQVDQSNEAGRLGTAFHEYMRAGIQGHPETIQDLAQRFEISVEDLTGLIANFPFDFAKDIEAGAKIESEAKAELKIGKYTISLQVDYREDQTATGEGWSVYDWKTTRLVEQEADAKDHWQLIVYGLETMESKGADVVHVAAVLVRLGRKAFQTPYTITKGAAKGLKAELEAAMSRAERAARTPADRRRYNVGSHCDYCPARMACPGLRELQVRPLQLAREASDLRETLEHEITTESAPRYYTAIKKAEEVLKIAKDVVRDFVETVGALPAGEKGKVLDVRDVAGRKTAISPGMVRMALIEAAAQHQYETGKEILPGTLQLLNAIVDNALVKLDDRPRGKPSARIGIFKEGA